MSFELKSIFSLEDRLTSPLRKMHRQLSANKKLLEKMNKTQSMLQKSNGGLSASFTSTSKASMVTASSQAKLTSSLGRTQVAFKSAKSAANHFKSGLSNISSGVSGATGNINSLTSSLLGLAGAYAGIQGAKSIFSSTVGEAMNMEQSEIVIKSALGDKKGDKYLKFLEDYSIESPVLNFQDALGTSKMLFSLTKEQEQLESLVGLTEKFVALNPKESLGGGTEGAVYSLNALFASGDVQSLKDRFGIDPKVSKEAIKRYKKDGIEAGTEFLQGWFDYTYGKDLIEDMGNTSLGKISQVRESFSKIFREMGKPSLNVVSEFMNDITKRLDGDEAKGFAETGAKWIKSILKGMTNSTVSIYDYFAKLTTSDKWKEASPTARVGFAIDDLFKVFSNWYDNKGGKEMISNVAEKVVRGFGTVVEEQTPTIIEIGKDVGVALVKGIGKAIADDPIVATLLGAMVGGKFGGIYGAIGGGILAGGASMITSEIKSNEVSKSANHGQKKGSVALDPYSYQYNYYNEKYGNGHSAGLEYVPHDGYKAELHKGEKVLTRSEADANRKGNGNNTYNFNISMNGTGSTEKDAKRLMELFVRELEMAGGAGA